MWLKSNKAILISTLAAGLLLGAGCATDDTDDNIGGAEAVDDPALMDIEVLQEGWPGNDTLPNEAKADQNFPAKFIELTETQSSVKSQGGRGVCSIFSTAAYMEHLYITEGTIDDPDFSEQFLQWSAKFEVGKFKQTGGSNAASNIRAIHEYGIPAEAAWPYESSKWTSSDDEACTGEKDQPTRCYTNGEPSEEAKAAEKFYLPEGRWHSTRTRSMKATMMNKRQAVVVGLTFFYQSWNHRRSQLPRNMDYWNNGYVLAPNAEDKRISLEKRAGHSILLLGWDDELEVPKRDEEGNVVKDAEGNTVVEKGFFLFKNSWGTGSFGVDNPAGDGYGWISYDYVTEYGSGQTSDLPEFEVPEEICGDGKDNDDNGDFDCDDAACSNEAACVSTSEVIEVTIGDNVIPDNDLGGLSVPFEITGPGEIEAMTVAVDITHAFRADVAVYLVSPEGNEETLHPFTPEAEEDLVATFVVDELIGEAGEGTWNLRVVDNAALDTGVVNTVTVEVVH